MSCCRTIEHDHGDHRRQVERPERRKESAGRARRYGIADVVEEPLDPVEPDRVRQPDPGHDDVRQDQEHVDADEDVHEALDASTACLRAAPKRGCVAHRESLRRSAAGSWAQAYAWLKKPPRSSRRARSSAETSTFRGVRRKTLSATRCIPPLERVREAAREVDQPLRELRVRALQVEDHGDRLLELVRDLLRVVEAARDDEVHARGAGPAGARGVLDAAQARRRARSSAARALGLGPVLELALAPPRRRAGARSRAAPRSCARAPPRLT